MESPRLQTSYQKRRVYYPFRINDLVLIRKKDDMVGRGSSGQWFPYYGPYMVKEVDENDGYGTVMVEDLKSGALLTILFPYERVTLYREKSHFPGHFVLQLLKSKAVACPFMFANALRGKDNYWSKE